MDYINHGITDIHDAEMIDNVLNANINIAFIFYKELDSSSVYYGRYLADGIINTCSVYDLRTGLYNYNFKSYFIALFREVFKTLNASDLSMVFNLCRTINMKDIIEVRPELKGKLIKDVIL